MYPVTIGYAGATLRIRDLIKNGHHAEALVTTVFTVEKTFRRTLRQIVVSAGFRSATADKIVNELRGLEAVKKAWELYDPEHRALTAVIDSADWKTLKDAAEKRNKLAHGVRVYKLTECQEVTAGTLGALERVKAVLDTEYGYSGWEKLKVRKRSRLHVDPAVTIHSKSRPG